MYCHVPVLADAVVGGLTLDGQVRQVAGDLLLHFLFFLVRVEGRLVRVRQILVVQSDVGDERAVGGQVVGAVARSA